MSAGVKGARVSIGPRGTYVHVGAGGFRYSRRIDLPSSGQGSSPVPKPPTPSSTQSIPPGRTVEVLHPSQLVDSNPDELLEEIRRKEQITGIVPFAIAVSVIGFVLFLITLAAQASPWVTWALCATGLLALIALPWATWSDRRARLVRLHYVFDPLGDKVQEGLERLLAAFERAHAIWAVNYEHVHGDWKRNAGAGTSVFRRRVSVGRGGPAFIQTNARVGSLYIEGIRLFFFPDRLLIYGSGGVSAVRYTDLSLNVGNVHFREEGGVPRDAKVLGKTWRFVNKGGGPDLRFKNNYEIPIVLYGTLDVSAPSGFKLSLQTSTDGLASSSVELLRIIQAAVRDLESRRVRTARLESLPSFADDPPPLYLPGATIFESLGNISSFQWLERLPEWATLTIWGILFALPPVALIIWFAQGGTAANIFLCLAFTAAGAATGILLYKYFRSRQKRRTEQEAATKSRFRALLANELKNRPLAELDFAGLLASSGISRPAADIVADDMFRKVADRFASDGVITEKERGKLKILSKALDMSPARADRVESEAKAARYQQAVSEAVADGTVTAEEAHLLNNLRRQLGVEDSPWTAGELVPQS
jgi:hypothetical protein